MFAKCDDWETAPGTEDLIAGLFGTPKKFNLPNPSSLKTTSVDTKSSVKKSKSKKGKTLRNLTAKETGTVVPSGPESAQLAPLPENRKARIERKQKERKIVKEEKRKARESAAAIKLLEVDPSEDTPDSSYPNHLQPEECDQQDTVEPQKLMKKKRKITDSYLEQAEKRLKGSQFRLLNERLYTSTGEEAMEFFKDDPDAFTEYHDGYREQIAAWPDKPVLQIINWLKKQPKNWIVADFGCGEAHVAASIPQKCHSFDLCALNDRVTVCNMTDVPLPNDSVDVAVFCLSLMGTNIVDFLLEARRVLRVGGILKIAEVGSRFENVKQFVHKTERLGFSSLKKNSAGLEGNYFIFLEFKKSANQAAKGDLPEIKLKPCIYKKR